MEAGAQLVHDEALQIANCDGAIAIGAAAGGFARRVAHAATNGAEGIGGGDGLESFLHLAFPDITDIGGRIGADGARHLAGRGNEVDVLNIFA